MRKYRVLQQGNSFYPQEKKWFSSWKYIDSIHYSYTWSESDKSSKNLSHCFDLKKAKEVIKLRKELIENRKIKPIYHYLD